MRFAIGLEVTTAAPSGIGGDSAFAGIPWCGTGALESFHRRTTVFERRAWRQYLLPVAGEPAGTDLGQDLRTPRSPWERNLQRPRPTARVHP